MIFLREVPPEVMEGVASGLYKVTGSVVREVSSGRGVAFLQETNVLGSILGSALKGVGATLQNGLNPLSSAIGLATVIQNQQIKSRLAEVQSSLALLQHIQLGTLAVSGLGLGVSIAGFAVMLKRLKGIETHLRSLEGKIDGITSDRRSDDIRMILADLRTHLEAVETLPVRTSKTATAEAAERALALTSGRLEAHFQQRSESAQRDSASPEELDLLWSLAAAIRLCHEAGLRALFIIDELQAARHLASHRADQFHLMTRSLSPDALARLCARGSNDFKGLAEARRRALPHAEALVAGLRSTVTSIASQAELAEILLQRQVPGTTYLRAMEEKNESPLLVLPS